MRLIMFRLSLKPKRQRDVFERKREDGSEFDRKDWLIDKFSRQFSFTHHGNEFFFVPQNAREVGFPDDLIIGWLARDRQQTERTPPWEGLTPTEHQSWQASLLLLDPSEHADGQKLALEQRSDVGGPQPVLASLVESLNDQGPEEPFSVAVFPIIEARSFVRFANLHVGKIKVIEYDVAVPNMFNSPDDFSSELKKLRDNGNVARVKTKLESDGAIDTSASQLDEIAAHVEKGGGKIIAKTTDGERYNSDDHSVSEEIDTSGTDPETPPFWDLVRKALDRIF